MLKPNCSLDERARIHIAAAACGNAASSLIFVPKEMIKQRLQAARVAGTPMGVRKVVSAIVKENGVRGLYAAYSATLLRNIPTTALKWLIYEELRLRLVAGNESAALPVRSMLCGALSGASSSIIMTPVDVVKTRLATGQYLARLGLRGSLVKLATEEGLAGLFAGAQARMLGAALFSAIGLSTYEACKHLLRCSEHETATVVLCAADEPDDRPVGSTRRGGEGLWARGAKGAVGARGPSAAAARGTVRASAWRAAEITTSTRQQ